MGGLYDMGIRLRGRYSLPSLTWWKQKQSASIIGTLSLTFECFLYINMNKLDTQKQPINMDLSEIRLEYIEESIPSILLKKFTLLNINTLKDVMDIDIDNFANIKGIGVGVVDQLHSFRETIISRPMRFLIYKFLIPRYFYCQLIIVMRL